MKRCIVSAPLVLGLMLLLTLVKLLVLHGLGGVARMHASHR